MIDLEIVQLLCKLMKFYLSYPKLTRCTHLQYITFSLTIFLCDLMTVYCSVFELFLSFRLVFFFLYSFSPSNDLLFVFSVQLLLWFVNYKNFLLIIYQFQMLFCVCVCIYIYIYIFIYIQTCAYVCVYIYIYMYVCLYTNVEIYVNE